MRLLSCEPALKIINYLGRPSLRWIQNLIVVSYFLMNDDHASDKLAFAGLIIRHAYALGLNQDPSIIDPNAQFLEKEQRRKALASSAIPRCLLSHPKATAHSNPKRHQD